MLLSREATISEALDWLDENGTEGKTATAHLVLGNEDQITINAGGPGIHARPAVGPFESYEVLTSGEPPRFWHKYGDTGGVVFARVPRLLIAHHVARSGGITDMTFEASRREEQQLLNLKMMVKPGAVRDLRRVLGAMVGVQLISSHLTP